jgi:hypothetical protein
MFSAIVLPLHLLRAAVDQVAELGKARRAGPPA